MLRVIRNHRRAAHGESRGYEALAVSPVPLDHASCPQADVITHAKAAWDKALELGELNMLMTLRPGKVRSQDGFCP